MRYKRRQALTGVARRAKRARGVPARACALIVAPLCLVLAAITTAPGPVGMSGAMAQSSGAPAAASPGCASAPAAPGCAPVAIGVDVSSLLPCTGACHGYSLTVGSTVRLPIDVTWSDGTSGPLSALVGSGGPAVDVLSMPSPAGALSAPVLADLSTGVSTGPTSTLVVEAFGATTSPLTLSVGFEGVSSAPVSLGTVPASAACGAKTQPVCAPADAGLVDVSAQAITGTASEVPAGGFAAISQALDPTTGAELTGAICYPPASPEGGNCGSAQAGSVGEASPTGCDLAASASCDVAAAWTAPTNPDIITFWPPGGWSVASVQGCPGASGGTPLAATCAVAPTAGSAPLDVDFVLEPFVTLQIAAQGPAEPPISCGSDACPGMATVYDDDVMNGVVATVGSATTGWAWCDLSGGVAGELGASQAASCQLTLPAGAYTVSIPATVQSSQGEVGVPYTYVDAPNPQTVEVLGGGATVSFSSSYEPALDVEVTGPQVPCQLYFCDGSSTNVYDNASLDGNVVSVVPASSNPAATSASTGGAPAPGTCTLEGGVSGYGTDIESPAFCQLYLPPGTYTVMLPSTLATPLSLSGAATAYPSGASMQSVSLAAGDVKLVQFATSGPPQVQVRVTGPAEPDCMYGCSTGDTIYDNDAVDGITVTATPASGTPGGVQTCQLEQGYPGDATTGQPASCLLDVSAGAYTVSLPASFATPDSEVGIGTAYVSDGSSRSVTAVAGNTAQVSFATVYEPSVQIEVSGPVDPACGVPTSSPSSCPQDATDYDDDAVNGLTATVTPNGGGQSQTCELSGGVAGAGADAVAANCTVALAPGEYTVSIPSRWAPAVDYGWGDVSVSGQQSQPITVTAGDQQTVSFTSAFADFSGSGAGTDTASTNDGLISAHGLGGTGTVAVDKYSADPEAPFASKSAVYFRVDLGGAATFTELTISACGLSGYSESAYWWAPSGSPSLSLDGGAGGSAGAWQAVATGTNARPGSTNDGSTAKSLHPGCIAFQLGQSTSPALADLESGTGIIFAVPVGLEPQTIRFVSVPPSPAHPGMHYLVRAVASSGGKLVYAAATSSTRACTVSDDGLVVLHQPGTCQVVATQAGDRTWAYASAQQSVRVLLPAPVASDFSYTTAYQKALVVGSAQGLLSRANERESHISISRPPAHGKLALRQDGAFVYTPARGYSGTDLFQYTLSSTYGRSVGTVIVKVQAPTARTKGRRSHTKSR